MALPKGRTMIFNGLKDDLVIMPCILSPIVASTLLAVDIWIKNSLLGPRNNAIVLCGSKAAQTAFSGL